MKKYTNTNIQITCTFNIKKHQHVQTSFHVKTKLLYFDQNHIYNIEIIILLLITKTVVYFPLLNVSLYQPSLIMPFFKNKSKCSVVNI